MAKYEPITVTYEFNKMEPGAKKEALRDFIGSIAAQSSKELSQIYSNLMNALEQVLEVEELAEVAICMYLHNDSFKKFADTGKLELDMEPKKATPKMVKTKKTNPDFEKIMNASFGADYMPNFGADGVIYKVSDYNRAKSFGIPSLGIPVMDIDTNTVIGYIPEFVEE